MTVQKRDRELTGADRDLVMDVGMVAVDGLPIGFRHIPGEGAGILDDGAAHRETPLILDHQGLGGGRSG